jgi:2-polyprenyl-6-methoxyphenol hydroxylase-like FAD-dependent oxidoreductase
MAQSSTPRRGEHVVIIGASMGGLVAAAAVAPFYDRVTVLERDELPTSPAHRRGVPQGKHAHGFQPGGLAALEDLLPGTNALLDQGGAPSGDTSANCTWHINGYDFAQGRSGVQTIGITRPFVEHTVRTQVAALPNVTLNDQVEVRGPITLGQTVIGVLIADGDATVEVHADLVIDASGRASRMPEWLTEMGLPAPTEEQVHCKLAYLSRRWMLTSDEVGTDVVRVSAPNENAQFGVCIAQEDGTHIITLGGLLNNGPENSEDAYRAFAAALPAGNFGKALEGAVPVTDMSSSHFPYSRRRRFDRLGQHAVGLIAIGDAVASFNPGYGQGMSVASMEAVALREHLQRGALDPKRYYRAVHKVEDVAWKISTGGDLKYEGVEGNRTPDVKIMNNYLDKFARAAENDPVLGTQFTKVAGFMAPPQSLFKPNIVWRVIRGNRRAKAAATAATRGRMGATGVSRASTDVV